jgi:hypothetical protein
MTEVTVELKNQAVKVKIKKGQYVEIDEHIYICAEIGCGKLILISLNNANRYDEAQEGEVYTYNEDTRIRFIDSIKITEK